MKKHWILIVAIVLFVAGVVLSLVNGGIINIAGHELHYFSSGEYAIGVFAAGTFSIGIFSAGIFSIGIFSIGIFNIGLYALGIFALGWKKKCPNFSEKK
jgi:quaternary ammonium compound-resistance protein SugE